MPLLFHLNCYFNSSIDWYLVGSVCAVNVTVAAPLGVDAELGTCALELAFAAGRVAVDFITAVVTVELAIAAQGAANAAPVAAAEFRLAAVARSASYTIHSKII